MLSGQNQVMANLLPTESIRQKICTWLRANQIDPDQVPITARPRVRDGQITIAMVDRQALAANLTQGSEVPTAEATMLMLTAPTGVVAKWCRL